MDQSRVTCSSYATDELFCASNTEFRKNGAPILCESMNLKLKIVRPKIGGFGIYGITFLDSLFGERLIYLGKYQGSSANGRYGGNIIADRWRKHLYTISMRGHNVAVDSVKAFETVRAIAESKSLHFGSRFISLNGQALEDLFEKNGCQSSFNRMMFSIQNEKQIHPSMTCEGFGCMDWLKSFRFYYWRVNPKHGSEVNKIKADLGEVEAIIIKKYASVLPCNKEYRSPAEIGAQFIHYDPSLSINIGSEDFSKLGKFVTELLAFSSTRSLMGEEA
jgi:hypothetical protein